MRVFRKELFQNHPIYSSPLFYFGLVFKLILSTFLASSFLTQLFIPFVDYFTTTGHNPYQHFLNQGGVEAFPYPGLMLLLLSLPSWILSPILGDGWPYIEKLAYRLPLLVMDFSLLLVLTKWLKQNVKEVLLFYWCSPILIYISYIHGQLDVIPMGFVFLSLYMLFKRRLSGSALLLGAAISTKLNMVVLLPFFVLYLYRQKFKILDIGKVLLLAFSVFAVVSGFFWSEGYFEFVFNNKAQFDVFNLMIPFSDSLHIFVVPTIFALLVVKCWRTKNFNNELLIVFLGLGFGILTLFVPPMPGWYYWVYPFLVYFIIRRDVDRLYSLWILQGLYLVYFIFFPPKSMEIWGLQEGVSSGLFVGGAINLSILKNVVFSLLQTAMFVNCFWLFQGITKDKMVRFGQSPFLLGISGDSSVGKSLLSKSIQKIFEPQFTTIICGDDRHRWERGHEKWAKFTHLDPKANDLHAETESLKQLKKGRSVYRRSYNHQTGQFDLPTKIHSNKLVVFEGLHGIFLPSYRRLFDLKIFLNPDESLRRYWKIKRDTQQRSAAKEKVMEQIERRVHDGKKFVQSQKAHADIVIEYYAKDERDLNVESYKNPEIGVRVLFSNAFDIEKVADKLSYVEGLEVKHEYIDEDRQLLEVEGCIHKEKLEEIAFRLIPDLEDNGLMSEWSDGIEGVIQLIVGHTVFTVGKERWI